VSPADQATDQTTAGLAARQHALLAALVGAAAPPEGFDPVRLAAAATVLLHKRARAAGNAWPALRAGYDVRWWDAFQAFATHRVPRGALLDGWDLARAVPPPTAQAAIELARCEARWHYPARGPVRRRRLPAVRRAPSTLVFQCGGRIWTVRLWPRRP
jgi:hypothetical protein